MAIFTRFGSEVEFTEAEGPCGALRSATRAMSFFCQPSWPGS